MHSSYDGSLSTGFNLSTGFSTSGPRGFGPWCGSFEPSIHLSVDLGKVQVSNNEILINTNSSVVHNSPALKLKHDIVVSNLIVDSPDIFSPVSHPSVSRSILQRNIRKVFWGKIDHEEIQTSALVV